MADTERERRGPCIVVGYDGSEPARVAVEVAAERAGAEGRMAIVVSDRLAHAR